MNHEALIEANQNAPADRLIRAAFSAGAIVTDLEERRRLYTVEDALQLWYEVDELRLAFRLDGRAGWALLIHQDRTDRPTDEDISDHSVGLGALFPAVSDILA